MSSQESCGQGSVGWGKLLAPCTINGINKSKLKGIHCHLLVGAVVLKYNDFIGCKIGSVVGIWNFNDTVYGCFWLNV